MTDPQYTQPLRRQLDLWVEQVETIDSKIEALRNERASVVVKMEAALVLLGERPPRAKDRVEESPSVAGMPLREAILSLMADRQARSANDIRRDLVAGGYEAAKVSPKSGHFYSLLKELATEGTLMRDCDGRYRIAAPMQSAA